ncbi:hypothetical protein [Bacillus alkalicellulosilyticus]|uniref:hypothetical protein n=1 Tax=Alkalihalobacterium alkalicellulosilyticum TaxID=1912214 RepID=UPI001482BBBA|nr:hypothetical protein [Bacillus alkalicellulosilyticus]
MEALNQTNFVDLDENALLEVDGGLVITAGAVIAGVLFLGGVGLGVAWALSE